MCISPDMDVANVNFIGYSSQIGFCQALEVAADIDFIRHGFHLLYMKFDADVICVLANRE